MIILTDCLSKKVDEGCIKVANSLAKRLKRKFDNTILISYNNYAEGADYELKLNKLFINIRLYNVLSRKMGDIFYIPFSSNTKASVIRTFILSKISRKQVFVMYALRFPMGNMTKRILKRSGAKIIALSMESFDYYLSQVGNEVIYLKTGVDTDKFIPVDNREKEKLRRKYNIADGKKVILHVGHLKNGRNVDKLAQITDDYHVLLVVSSVTAESRDNELWNLLRKRPNTTIIDSYLPNIEEVYQLSDVYLFPVQEETNCIDVPLSVLEAASCNIPIVCTNYGELKSFKGRDGFIFLDDVSREPLQMAIDSACNNSVNTRNAVMQYDWNISIENISKYIN